MEEELQQFATEDLRDTSELAEEDLGTLNREIVDLEIGDDLSGASASNGDDHQLATRSDSSTPSTSFVKIEKSLASLGFFTPSSRRIKNQKMKKVSMTREVDGKRVEVSAEIHPSAMFGLPVTADQDKFLALQKIITNTLQSEGKVENPIRFKSADLLRLLDTSRRSGKNFTDIGDWLDVMSGTTIKSMGAIYSTGRKTFVHDRFHVFERAVSVGQQLDDGSIADANYIWLSPWQLENINNKFLMPVDLESYRELKNHIAKALVPLLQIWLYASNKAGLFEKRYDELCEMLTLQLYPTPSQISRQFKPSLDELAQHGYIEKWRIERTGDRKGFKIVFFHGAKFHRDRRRRAEQRGGLKPPVVVAEYQPEEPSLPQPGRVEQPQKEILSSSALVQLEETREPEKEGAIVDALSHRGLVPSTVIKLLKSLPAGALEKVPDIIEYWDEQKKTKEVTPGLLYELIRTGELPSGFETSKQRSDRLADEAKRSRQNRLEEALKVRYADYCRQAVDQYIAQIPPEELDRRIAEYAEGMRSEPGYWSDRPEMATDFARHTVRAAIAKEATLQDFETFRREQLPAMLAERQLDPADFGLPQNVATETTPQNAINEALMNDRPPEEGASTFKENSSPQAL